MEKQEIPGLAIAIVDDQQVVYKNGFGTQDITRKQNVTPDTLLHMASVTKPFVAAALMQLEEAGKLKINDPVINYLPYFRVKGENYRAITIRQLLSHTSGLPDNTAAEFEWNKPQYDGRALERYVRSLSNRSLIAAPGTKVSYSNIGYSIAGDVIAKVSGETFEGYVKNHILLPLGMKNSTLLLKQVNPETLAAPHVLNESYEVAKSGIFPYNRAHASSSTLYSNINEMSRWAIANLNKGTLNNHRILSSTSYEVMWNPVDERWPHRGVGWGIETIRGQKALIHTGRNVGFVSTIVLLPEAGVGVVTMANYNEISLTPLVLAAIDVALGNEPKPLVIKQSVGAALYRIIMKQGIKEALIQYEYFRNRPDEYKLLITELNILGYALLKKEGMKREAIKIFQLNAKVFPKNWGVYDSLADAYKAAGEKNLAIRNYEKSLELNPRNKHAEEQLKTLRQ